MLIKRLGEGVLRSYKTLENINAHDNDHIK